MANPNAGRFSWHELMSTDVAAAAKFYGALFGWQVQEVDMGPMGTYRLFLAGEKQVGGAMAAPPNVPSHWLTYVTTDDADASAKKAEQLGAKIVVPPATVPEMVRFAVAMDPQGAGFGMLKPLGPGADEPMPEGPLGPGHFVWNELYTKDKDGAAKFYGALFGWTGKVAEGDPMQYFHWRNQGKDIGGMMTLPAPNIPPHWLAYIAVSDVDASTTKVKELGGKVMMEPMDIPKVGQFSVVTDPQGAAFALFRSARA